MTDAELKAFADLCDRCKYKVHPGEPELCGQGQERFITGNGGTVDLPMFGPVEFPAGSRRLWLCDACWLEVGPVKGGA